MNWINQRLEEFQAVVSLIVPALRALYQTDPHKFWCTIGWALGLAVGMHLSCRLIGKLWFKRFKPNFPQNLLSMLATVLTALGAILWVAGNNLRAGLALILVAWQGAINEDGPWAQRTFVARYETVKKLGLEDFTNHPHPSRGGTTIPLNASESRLQDARVVIGLASVHFAGAYPALGRLLKVTDGLAAPISRVKNQVDAFFATGEHIMPAAKTIKMCAEILKETFEGRYGALVAMTRWIAVGLPVISWLALYVWIARASSKIIKSKVVKRSAIKPFV